MSYQPRRQPVVLSAEERRKLESWARRGTSQQRLALRSDCVVVFGKIKESRGGASPGRLQAHRRQVAGTVSGTAFGRLGDEPRPGAPRTIGDEKIEEVITKTLEQKPAQGTHWSRRSMARATGLNHDAIGRIWRAFGLKPHLEETFKLSSDPWFTEKVRDITGLYLSPPTRAIVLMFCFS